MEEEDPQDCKPRVNFGGVHLKLAIVAAVCKIINEINPAKMSVLLLKRSTIKEPQTVKTRYVVLLPKSILS